MEKDTVTQTDDVPQMDHMRENEVQESFWQAAMNHKLVLVHCLAAFSAGAVFGYDNVASAASVSMPAFQIYFGAVTPAGALYLPSIWTSLWTAMSALFQAFGGMSSAPVADKFGRKWVCVAVCFLSVAGVIMQYMAESRGLLLGGKMVNGFAVGSLLSTATAWASEISPVRLRGPVQSGIVLFTTLMQGIGLVVIRCYATDLTPHAFRVVFAVMFAWPVLTAILFSFMPESPTWLVLKGRNEQAKRSLSRLYGSESDIGTRLSALEREIEHENQLADEHGTGSYLDLLKGTTLMRTLTVMWLFIGAGLNGAALLAQNPYFLVVAGLEPVHTYDIGIGGFGLAVLTIVASWFYMEKFGRRSIWLAGVVGNIIVMAIIGALYYVTGSSGLYAIAVLMNVLIAWQILTMTSVAWVITAELSTYRLRAKTQSLAVVSLAFATWFFAFIVPYMYNTDSGNLGARTGFVFMGGSILLLVGSYFLVPDLHGLSTDEVDWLYVNKVPVRHFREYTERARMATAENVLGATPGDGH